MRRLLQRTHKRCPACNETLPMESFHRAGKYWQGKCKTCVVKFVSKWRIANPEKLRQQRAAYMRKWRASKSPQEKSAKYRRDDLRRHYGLTIGQYESKFAEQKGVCAICEMSCPSGRRLAVDHNHRTEAIRGLLCAPCNHALARLDVIPNWPFKAMAYIEKYEGSLLQEEKESVPAGY